MKKIFRKIKKYNCFVFTIIFLIIISSNIFAKGAEYGDMYYAITVPNSQTDEWLGEIGVQESRVLIGKKGNKICSLLPNEKAEILKDLYSDEPKLLIKYSTYRNLFNISTATEKATIKKAINYNPIYNYASENLIEMYAPYWWYHEDIYKATGYGAEIGTKVKVYDLNGNDLNIEFQTIKEYVDAIWTFDNIVLYVNHNENGDEMYYFNLSTKEKKKLGNYEMIDKYQDKIVAYKTNINEEPLKYNKSSVGFFTEKMELIKEFNGYEKIDYVKVNEKNYYVLTYNKLVLNKRKGDKLANDYFDNYRLDECRRYANFVDENLNFVFGKDIFIDYEGIENDFDYEKVFNENVANNNIIFGPHNRLIEINDINLIIELKDETIYMICDEKGYAICDENKNIIGDYFDRPIFIHNISDKKEKLIFSYELDDVSYFIQYWNDEYEDLYFDGLDIEELKKTTHNYECEIYETKLGRQYFYIKNNKIEYLKNIEDMVLVALNLDGFYFYHQIYGNNALTYLRKSKNDLGIYKNKIYDLDGNVYDLNGKMTLEYITNIYKINNKYVICPMSSVQYRFDYDFEVYDFYGDKILDQSKYIFYDGKLMQENGGKNLYLYDEDFKISKQIDISNSNVEFKYSSIILTNRKTKEQKVYDINFNEIKDTNLLPYNFINRKNAVKSNVVSNNNKIIGPITIEIKPRGYEIGTNADKKYYLKDSKNNKMLLENYRYLDFFSDKYIEYQYGFKFGLMDYSLNKFCEFSIFDFNLP